jgi:hypothetical protein
MHVNNSSKFIFVTEAIYQNVYLILNSETNRKYFFTKTPLNYENIF